MEKNYIITAFAVKRETPYSEMKILGKTPREYLAQNLTADGCFSVVETDDPTAAERSKTGDFSVLLYSDMPLVTKEEIIGICKSMVYGNLDGARIKDARIYKNNPSDIPAVINLRNENFLAVSDGQSFAEAYGILRKKILLVHIERGVIIPDLNSVSIDADVLIKKGTYIAPNNVVKGNTVIGQNNRIESGNIIENCAIGDENTVVQSNLSACNIAQRNRIEACIFKDGAKIGDENIAVQSNLSGCNIAHRCSVGPFATLREGAEIGSGCRIGDYVEIKKSVLRDGVKSAHLAYIGDAEIGQKTNVGCGTVFANYNGKIKQKTFVGENVFIGANTNLVAPLTVGNNAFIAAGSTITENIPENSFAIARERQIIKERKKD
ncbi:MAG: hypothetical protein LBP62_01285 [Clostridiales bacterium]|jgi:bifunctional N-acetylglucosamine-1-phosphate-uridyltransferase/glucosamine-1-phosphate-acetyltransferase GlmU-like protein|nr:hypothetical protein [Clostridiales bacterium]